MLRVSAVILAVMLSVGAWGGQVDLSQAVIVVPGGAVGPVARAGEMLRDEIAARTGCTLGIVGRVPDAGTSTIVLASADVIPTGTPSAPAGLTVPEKAEGFAIWVDTGARGALTVCLIGRDSRGVVFAVGRLLRSLTLEPRTVKVDPGLRVSTAPAYSIRGHHIGFDDNNNTFDAWDIKQFEQYCRDLFAFGTNAIELCPTLDPTLKDSPHMKCTMWEMNAAMSRVVGSYGMDLWAFVPVLEDLAKPGVAQEAMAKRVALFRALPCLDAILVPGGDPGENPVSLMLPFLSDLSQELHVTHPKAGIWLSNQGFKPEDNDALFAYLAKESPEWLAGLIYGPWTKMTLEDMRARTPAKYPIRYYQDFTHCIRCQYPVPGWDPAFARTLAREPINPLPQAMTRLSNLYAPLTVGAIPYSEGVNDDFNKIAWSLLAWEPSISVDRIGQEYGRYFAGPRLGDAVGEGFCALERNWEGAIARNRSIPATAKAWGRIERKAGDKAFAANWRLQQGAFRAYYDEYVQRRLTEETGREARAMKALAKASQSGALEAIAGARAALATPDKDPEIARLRERLVTLGRSIFDTVGMQMDVKHYKARNPERGAVLEFLDVPLNDRDWLLAKLDALPSGDSPEALAGIDSILKWEHPGEGGFYDDLGHSGRQPHLVRQKTVDQDPGGVVSPTEEFCDIKGGRLSWMDQAQTLYGTPLRMRYEGLDPRAEYRLRVTYAGRFKATMRLVADGATEIHGALKQPSPIAPVEFPIPKAASADGVLELEWQLVEGRGCQVAEVWLIRQ